MTIFNYSGSGILYSGVTYKNSFFSSTQPTFDAGISADASISSFDKIVPTLDFSNSKNNSSSSVPTTFDSGNVLPVTFDLQDQRSLSSSDKSASYSISGSGSITISSAKSESNTEVYISSGRIVFGSIVLAYCSSSEIFVNTTLTTVDNKGEVTDFIGSLNALEKTSSTPPAISESLTISSAKTESNTESYVGSGTIVPAKSIIPNKTFDSISTKFDDDDVDTSPIFASFDKDQIAFTLFNPATLLPLTYDSSAKNANTFDRGSSQIIPNFGAISISYSGYIGSGSITLTGVEVEKNTESYVGTGSIILLGELVHPQIDFTPSWSGSGSITISGVEIEKNVESYIGSGIVTSGRSYIPPTVQTFDENEPVFDIDGNKLPTYVSFDKDYLNFAKFNVSTISPLTFDNSLVNPSAFINQTQSLPSRALESFIAQTPENIQLFSFSGAYNDLKAINSWRGTGSITLSGELVHPKIDLTPHYGIEQNIGIGTYVFSISGSALESFCPQTPENIQLFTIGKSAIPPVPTIQTFDQSQSVFDIDGNKLPTYASFDKDYLNFAKFNVGTVIPLTFDNGLRNPASVGVQTQYIPSRALESFIAQTPENIQLFSFSGAYNDLKATSSWRGTGSITISGTPLIHPQVDLTPHYGIEQNIGIGTYAFSISGSAQESFIAQTPEDTQLFSIGVRKLPAAGFGGNPELYTTFDKDNFLFQQYQRNSIVPPRFDSAVVNPGVLGLDQFIYSTANESISYATYVGSGTPFTFSSGLTDERNIESYVGVGSITLSGELVHPKIDLTPHYGIEQNIGIGTYAFSISGSAQELFIAQTPENNQLFTIGRSLIPPVPVVQTFDQSQSVFDIDGNKLPTYVSFDKDYINFAKFNVATLIPPTFDNGLRNPASVGAQPQSIPSRALESFIAQTPENIQLFSFSGAYNDLKAINSEVGSGSITLSGELVHPQVDLTPHYGIEQNIGIGTYAFTISGSAQESFIAQTPENTQLFNIGVRKLPAAGFGGNPELYTTFDKDNFLFQQYQRPSIIPPRFDSAVVNPGVLGLDQFIYSTANESISYATYVGSTITFTLSGSLVEKVSVIPPQEINTILLSGFQSSPNVFKCEGSGSIVLSGVEVEKNTESYVGSGIVTSGRSYIIPTIRTFDQDKSAFDVNNNALPTYVSFDKDYLIFDKFNVSTVSPLTFDNTLRNPDTISGTELQSLPNRALESFVANPPENIQLFNISGTGIEKNTEVYVGVGTATFSGTISELKGINAWYGSGSITLSGVDVEQNTESYVGSGIITSGRSYIPPVPLIQTFDQDRAIFDIDGNKLPTYVSFDKDYINFAEFNVSTVIPPTFDNTLRNPASFGAQLQSIPSRALESFVANPPENVELFNISGSLVEKNTESYVGSGSIILSGVEVEKNTESYVGTGTATFSGTAVEKNTESYVGTGTLTLSGSLVEKNTNIGIASGSVTLSGTRVERVTESYVGRGSITVSSSANESYSRFNKGAGSIVLSGVEVEKNVESYVGSGIVTSGRSYILPTERTFDQTQSVFDIDGNTLPAYISFDKDYLNFAKFNVATVTPLTFDNTLRNPNSIGATLQSIPSRALESFVANPPENVELFNISGSLVEKNTESYVGSGSIAIVSGAAEVFGANPPENIQLFNISGTGIEKNTEVYVGVGTATFSGTISELKATNSEVGSGSITLSGVEVEKNTESYVGTGSIIVSGSAAESFGLTTYRGSGSIQLYSSKLESTTILPTGLSVVPIVISGKPLVHPDIRLIPAETGSGVITLTGSIFPPQAFAYRGSGRITLSESAKTLAILPIGASGGFLVYGSVNESFTRRRYLGIGTAAFSGTGLTREIAVYTEVGIGTINLSSGLRERNTESYVGLGAITLSATNVERNTETYVARGRGGIVLSGSSENRFIKNASETTNLFVVSGRGNESFTRQRYLGIGTATFSGKDVTSLLFKSERGSGVITLSAASATALRSVYTYSGSGDLRFVRYVSDQNYDTCDSLNITSDYLNSAKFALVANPPENTQLFGISGSASTRRTLRFTYSGSGTVGISGFISTRKTNSVFGFGSITFGSVGVRKKVHSYKATGSINVSSASAKSLVKKSTSSTSLFTVSGSSGTAINRLFRTSGIGTQYFGSTSAETRKLSRVSFSGIGTINVSGQVVYPDVQFIPAPKGRGNINIIGSSNNKLTRKYSETSGVLFAFSGGKESYGRSGYVGVGTIRTQSTIGITVNNPYQIPRTYVWII